MVHPRLFKASATFEGPQGLRARLELEVASQLEPRFPPGRGHDPTDSRALSVRADAGDVREWIGELLHGGPEYGRVGDDVPSIERSLVSSVTHGRAESGGDDLNA
jgi:hypothetical protein